MKAFFTLLTMVIVGSAAYAETAIEAPKGTYKLDPTHASLTWKVNHLGLSNYTARFTTFDATLEFDPENVEASKLKATVEPMSVETDYPYPEQKDFNKKLKTDRNFFNANEYGTISFESTRVEKTGDNTGKLYGDLTMLGKTKPVVLDVTFNGSMKEHPYAKVGALGFSAHGTLTRSDWGMIYGIPYVGDEVELLIEAEFMEQKAE